MPFRLLSQNHCNYLCVHKKKHNSFIFVWYIKNGNFLTLKVQIFNFEIYIFLLKIQFTLFLYVIRDACLRHIWKYNCTYSYLRKCAPIQIHDKDINTAIQQALEFHISFWGEQKIEFIWPFERKRSPLTFISNLLSVFKFFLSTSIC